MRTKAEIEKTLHHMKTVCGADPASNTVWIQALEWVLGDAEHRAAFKKWLDTMDMSEFPPETPGERVYAIMLTSALARLR